MIHPEGAKAPGRSSGPGSGAGPPRTDITDYRILQTDPVKTGPAAGKMDATEVLNGIDGHIQVIQGKSSTRCTLGCGLDKLLLRRYGTVNDDNSDEQRGYDGEASQRCCSAAGFFFEAQILRESLTTVPSYPSAFGHPSNMAMDTSRFMHHSPIKAYTNSRRFPSQPCLLAWW